MKKFSIELLIGIFIVFFVSVGVYSNVKEQLAIDHSKLPEKVETNKSFQRWLTNLKNKNIPVSADDFSLLEENEIYNTKWMKVYSADDPEKMAEYQAKLTSHKNLPKVVFSPSENLYIDIRYEPRDGYNINEALFYGLLDGKIIDSRVVDCSIDALCYFDRAFFIENEIFVISEFSRNIDKKAVAPSCTKEEVCEYTFKIHLIDLKNNKRLVYKSLPFEAVWISTIPEL